MAEQPYTCWCGEVGDYDQMHDDDGLESACGGSGILHCYCGGDFCVCHHHGDTSCPGCEDCGGDDDDGNEFDDDTKEWEVAGG